MTSEDAKGLLPKVARNGNRKTTTQNDTRLNKPHRLIAFRREQNGQE